MCIKKKGVGRTKQEESVAGLTRLQIGWSGPAEREREARGERKSGVEERRGEREWSRERRAGRQGRPGGSN